VSALHTELMHSRDDNEQRLVRARKYENEEGVHTFLGNNCWEKNREGIEVEEGDGRVSLGYTLVKV